MSAQILDGKAVAEDIKQGLAHEVESLLQGGGRRPGLGEFDPNKRAMLLKEE